MNKLNATQAFGISHRLSVPMQPHRVLKACLVALVAAAVTPGVQAATTITTEPSSLGTLFPTVADVIAAKPSDPGLFADGVTTSLAQTVQSAGFDLKTIYIQYDDPDGATFDLNIFTVSDVSAATHAEPPEAGSILITESIALPATTVRTIAAIELDIPLTLAPNTGTAGYAVHIATGDTTFTWLRTGGTAGSVYAGGVAYETGVSKNAGARDFVLALDSLPVPEPSTAALLGLGVLLLLGRSQTRRVV